MSTRFLPIAIAFFATTISPTLAQQYVSDAEPVRFFQQGMDLLDKKKYGAAREEFENYLAAAPQGAYASDAEYYAAYSAVRLYNPDGEAKLADFIKNNRSDPKAIRANYELGDFYFRDEQYKKVIEYFEKTDVLNLTPEEETNRNFKLAYAYFTQQQFAEAKPLFDQIKAQEGIYTNAASYYAGYIAFKEGSYEEALTDLRRAEQEESYARVVPYLITSVFAKQGQYDRVIEYGEKIIADNQRQDEVANLPEIMLLVGDAYYAKKNYAKAEQYLQQYADNQRPTNEVRYQLAYAQYETDKNEAAIENFKQVASSKDSLGQYASYYLGILYVEEKNLEYAATAFETAASKDFNPEIKEQAAYNLGKVYLSREEFARAIQTFKDFRQKYPNSQYTVEVNDLLSEAYLNSQNYAEAMQFIEGLPNKTTQVRQAYQKVTYLAATQLFNQSKFPQAVKLFDQSQQYPIDPELVAAASFWEGEAYSIGKRYGQAIEAYNDVFKALQGQRLTGEKAKYHTKARYGLGYAYFNTKQYREALQQFEKYLQQVTLRSRNDQQNKYFYDDALMRLADSYYVTKSYGQAVKTYDRAIQENNPDIGYAYYQKGVIQGIQGQYAAGINNLETVILRYPDSPYRDDAIFQKAQLNFEQRNYDNAIAGFTQLINTQSQSNLVPYALLRRALAYSNKNQYQQASADYKRILDQYAAHKTANSALLGLQEVSGQLGNRDEFASYLSKYKQANPENANVANIEFESARNLYFEQDYDNAIQQLNAFINNYPNNGNVDEARYYIGESYYRSDRADQALQVLYEIEANGKYPRMSRVVQRIAELEQAQGSLANAVTYYQKLANLASNKKEQYNAWSGLMTTYYSLSDNNKSLLDSVSKYAQLIVEKANVSANAVNQALLYQGKAAYEQGNLEKAKEYFTQTVQAAKDVNGAEAQYLLAKILYDQQQHSQSIEMLYELNKNFSIYENWLGESFLLIADNYIAMDETFQAEATLNSVIENSPLEDIVTRARQKLQTLEGIERQQAAEQESDTMQSESVVPEDSVGQQ